MNRTEFIGQIGKLIVEEGKARGYKVFSPIIAQAIIESRYGESVLGEKYHNYFGLKCGRGWKGESVNLKTKEEYTPGQLTNISANFRVYPDMVSGVKGYFDFINTKRYQNLKPICDPKTYCETIKADGYATSSSYVDTLMKCIKANNLLRFDGENVIQNNTVIYPERTVQSSHRIDEEIAVEVIRGKWGNGRARFDNLTRAGYDYFKIQKIVNRMLRNGR